MTQYDTGSSGPYNEMSCQHDYKVFSDGAYCAKCYKPAPWNTDKPECEHEWRPFSDGNYCRKCRAFKPYPPSYYATPLPSMQISPYQYHELCAKLDEILKLLRDK